MAKDSWDKLDTIGKIVSSLVLVVIAMFIKSGSERIAFSLQSGQLVQSLISDLTTQEQQTRQDVALLALDNSIGDEKPRMVAAIAERLSATRRTRTARARTRWVAWRSRSSSGATRSAPPPFAPRSIHSSPTRAPP
jgi:hypothetical protein